MRKVIVLMLLAFVSISAMADGRIDSNNNSESVQQLEIARQASLFSALVKSYLMNHPISDEAIAKEYSNLKTSLGSKEYNVRHILVGTESEAKSIAAKLKNGDKNDSFDNLAKAHSKDSGSKEHGGNLGWIPSGNIYKSFVKPFGDAVMNLANGQVSDPVLTQYGWHIIKLEGVRDLKFPPLDEVKTQITQRLQQQAVKQMIVDLHDKAKIKYIASSETAALVNGISIPESRVNLRTKAVTAQGKADTPELRKAILEDLINVEIGSQEAVKLGLHQDEQQGAQKAASDAAVQKFLADFNKFKKCAIETRNPACTNNAGVAAQGLGNIELAKSWYTLAARYGESNAISNLRRLSAPVPEPDLLRQQQQQQQQQNANAKLLASGLVGILGAISHNPDTGNSMDRILTDQTPSTDSTDNETSTGQNATQQIPAATSGDAGYKSSWGTRYQYDLSKPADNLQYSLDLDAQMRDSRSINPQVKMDRSMGQVGGGVKQ